VVANTNNLQSLKKAKEWKDSFDLVTQVAGEPPFPVALIINHPD